MINDWQLQDIYEKSNNDIVVDLGRRFKSLRIALRLSQKDISVQSGVSVMTIVRFESGKGSSIRLDNLVALMRAVQKLEAVAEMIPDVPESLYAKHNEKIPQRVKPSRKDEK